MLFLTSSCVVWITVWSRSTNNTNFRCFCKRNSSSLPRFWASWKMKLLPLLYAITSKCTKKALSKLTWELTFSSGMLWTMAILALFCTLAVDADFSAFSSSIFLRSMPHCAHMSFINVGWGHSEESDNSTSPLLRGSPFFLKYISLKSHLCNS